MKLQILVTHYNEDEEIVATLLDSIEEQLEKVSESLFGVIIVNDGHTHPLSNEFLNRYSYRIEQYSIDKANVSVARNYALSKATAKYVMFCDCDDMFILPCAFQWIFREMPFTMLNSAFFEEKGELMIPHEHDSTFIHGKVYNRKFLLDNDLKFNEELQYHEDSYFVLLAETTCDTMRYFPHPFYLWKERKGSVARQKGYINKTWLHYLYGKKLLIEQLIKRDNEYIASFVANTLLIEARERNLTKANLKATAKFYAEFKDLISELDERDKADLEKSMSEMYQHEVVIDTSFYEKLLEV